ncbi:MAG: hypothetical protein ACR2RA_06255, partial [Geminicoccaceae bacterium]
DLTRKRLSAAKRAFTTRRVPAGDMATLLRGDLVPRTGDLVLASVQEIGKHRKIEQPNGRRALMMPGDEIIVCYGNRYAPDQFEALVPDDLSACDLVAGGGIASKEMCRHDRMIEPTRIAPIGLIADARGGRLNLSRYAIKPDPALEPGSITTILVAGTAMNSGKTFSAASLVRGLKCSGYRVAGIKSTGTGSGGDLWQMKDMGADRVLDFTDAGFASTYKIPADQIEAGVLRLIDHVASLQCQFAVVEIADGLQHEETATLMRSDRLRERSFGLLFAAYDSMGAKAGVEALLLERHNVLAISGQITRSPLAIREAEAALGCPVYTPLELQAGALVGSIDAAWRLESAERFEPAVEATPPVVFPLRRDQNSRTTMAARTFGFRPEVSTSA